jgi:hypothetical protein
LISLGTILVSSNSTINITGNLVTLLDNGTGWSAWCLRLDSPCTVNLTGNIYTGRNLTSTPQNTGITSTVSSVNLYLTGHLYAGRFENGASSTYGGQCVSLTGTAYVNHVGIQEAGNYIASQVPIAFVSTGGSSINILSGPFISGQYGVVPFYVTRMHLIPTLNNYFEFRDDSTNGALSPGPIASASRLVSPDTIIDAPTANNVRLGVSYGNGAYTGTCAIPSASNVALNIPFDTGSVGTAFISANDITNQVWGSLTANLTGSNTIGERLKNAATVSTTGAQIASF